MIPLVAGMMGMLPGRFFIANLLSALVWAPAYLLPGIVFGASLELASEVAFRLVLLILLMVAVIWLVVWSIHRIFLLLHPHATTLVQAVLRWSRLHPGEQAIGQMRTLAGHRKQAVGLVDDQHLVVGMHHVERSVGRGVVRRHRPAFSARTRCRGSPRGRLRLRP